MSAKQSAFTVVRLPRPLTVFAEGDDYERRVGIRVEGPGRVRAGGLRALDPNLPDGKRAQMFSYTESDGTAISASTDILPAGDYRLYGLLDRGPARVLLSSPELQGEAALVADVDVPSTAADLESRPGQSPGSTVFGRSASLSSEGLFYAQVRLDYEQAAGRSELCVYPSGDHDAADAYDVGCPGGESYYHPALDTRAPGSSALTIISAPQAGSYGFGGNFQFVPATADFSGVAAWFSLEPAGIAPPAVTPAEIGATSPAPAPPPTGGAASIVSRRAVARGGVLRVRVSCPGPSPCRTGLRVLPGGRRRSLSLPAGAVRQVRVPLGRERTRRLRRRPRLMVRLRLEGRDAAGGHYALERRVTVSRVTVR